MIAFGRHEYEKTDVEELFEVTIYIYNIYAIIIWRYFYTLNGAGEDIDNIDM